MGRFCLSAGFREDINGRRPDTVPDCDFAGHSAQSARQPDFAPIMRISMGERVAMTDQERRKLRSRNLELFRRCMPDAVYRRLKDLEPRWQLVFDDAGVPDLVAGGVSVLRPGDAADPRGGFAPGAVIRFTAKPPERNWIDVYTFRFLEATLRRATEEGIQFFNGPATPAAYFLVIFGVGLGRHVQPLIDMTGCTNVILVEPDLEFLWHSFEVCDWLELIAGVQAKGGDVDFIVTEDVNEISGNIWRTLRRTNPCSADGFTCCVHHHGHLVKRVIEDLERDVSLITGDLGFFYDETLMLWNAYHNLGQDRGERSAKVYSSAAGKDRGLPAFVVGSGPSLDQSIDAIKKNASKAVIISCGSALRPLMLNGIQPDFHIELENLNVSPLVSKVAEEHDLSSICILASSTVDPGALDPFGDAIFYFRYSLSPYPLFSESEDSSLHLGGPTVVNAGFCFAQEVGFRDIYLFGVDMGARTPENHHAKDSYHFAPEGAERDPREFRISVEANFGGECLTTRGLYTARIVLMAALGRPLQGRRYFNCSDGAVIEGASPTRPEDLSLSGGGADKLEAVREIIEGYSSITLARTSGRWPGKVLVKNINAYIADVIGCLKEIGDFTDKSYLTRLMGVFRPQMGYVDPPPREPMHAVNFLFRGTLLGMLVFFEFYLMRVGERTKVDRFGEIAREELIRELGNLKDDALDRLGGPAPKRPPPFSEITASAGESLPVLKRIPRNDPCPCGSGRKYKHCHGVPA